MLFVVEAVVLPLALIVVPLAEPRSRYIRVGVEAVLAVVAENRGQHEAGERVWLEEETNECLLGGGLLDQRRLRELSHV